MIDFGKQVRAYRLRANMPQRQLAQECHTHQTTISLIECGRILYINPGLLEQIAAALGVSEQQLLFVDPDRVQESDAPPDPTFDDGYRKAVEDVLDFMQFKEPALRKGARGSGKHALGKELCRKILRDPQAMENFKLYRHKAKYRVSMDGEILEIL